MNNYNLLCAEIQCLVQRIFQVAFRRFHLEGFYSYTLLLKLLIMFLFFHNI